MNEKLNFLEKKLLDVLIRPSIGTITKSRLVENGIAQELNFRVLLENVKSLYYSGNLIGQDRRDWNKLLEELLD